MFKKKERPVALIVGPKSQMKKKFLDSQKLFDRICPCEKFNIYDGSTHDIMLLKPQGFEMDSGSIQQSFTNFHSILDLKFQSLRMIFFVVKFDRIDNMKTLIKPFFVKFIDYSKNTTLVITGIEYSNQQEKDRELLIKNLVKYYKLQNYIICGSTEDVSKQILDKMTCVSNWQLDIKKLNLLPQKVDQVQLRNMKDQFRSRLDDDRRQYNHPQQPQQVSIVPYKQIPQSEIIGNYNEYKSIAQQDPDIIEQNQTDINRNICQTNNQKFQNQPRPQSEIVEKQTKNKNYTAVQSAQQQHVQKNQSNVQQSCQNKQNNKSNLQD